MKPEVNRWAKYGSLLTVILLPLAIGFVYSSIIYYQGNHLPDELIVPYHNTIYLVWGVGSSVLFVLYLLWGMMIGWWHKDKLDQMSNGMKILIWLFTFPGYLVTIVVGAFFGAILSVVIILIVVIAIFAFPSITEIGRQSSEQRKYENIRHAVRRGVEKGIDDAFK